MTDFNNNPEIIEALKEAYEWGYNDGHSDGREGHGDKSGRDECAYTLAEQIIGNKTEIVGWLYEYDVMLDEFRDGPLNSCRWIERWVRRSEVKKHPMALSNRYTRNVVRTPLIKGF